VTTSDIPVSPAEIAAEVARRRTFAIISHPDAGKTTLTEKLLLYSGAIHTAGSVRTRGDQQHATSDWMTMEQDRGISITASALEMEYDGFRINLLDTPGHQDFSEDTYRTLMAVDSAVMVLDSARGIEAQTLKLFEVCRMRHIPILTFINKLDHDGKDPLELLDEIETTLKLTPVPMNWPVGTGPWFQGVYDLNTNEVLRFERTHHNAKQAPISVRGLDDPELASLIGETAAAELREQAELLTVAGTGFDEELFLGGELTPVFFGSALNNFGVEPFLNALLRLAPAPGERDSTAGVIEAASPEFTGFIFKIQANMDLRHRDRIAFMRICSGRFERDMVVHHARLGKKVRLGRAYRLFARERDLVEEAYAGDVIGVINPGTFSLGDSISSGAPVQFAEIPRFSPERFASLLSTDVSKYKQFNKGLEQLEEEGALQVFRPIDNVRLEPTVGVVGELQFDVVLARLKDEYGVEARLERQPYTVARWVEGGKKAAANLKITRNIRTCEDRKGGVVLLFGSNFDVDYFQRQNPDAMLRSSN
jgi:peptide chain release factor 3